MGSFRSFVPLFLFLSALPTLPQQPVGMNRSYERLLCIVPIVGGGSPEDPLRPMFAPLPESEKLNYSDNDYLSNQMMYRNVRSYAVGHGCAAAQTEVQAVAVVVDGAVGHRRRAAQDQIDAGGVVEEDAVVHRRRGVLEQEQAEIRLEFARLKQDHADFDAAINAMIATGCDPLQIQRMKKKKLALKDRLSQLEDRIIPDIIA